MSNVNHISIIPYILENKDKYLSHIACLSKMKSNCKFTLIVDIRYKDDVVFNDIILFYSSIFDINYLENVSLSSFKRAFLERDKDYDTYILSDGINLYSYNFFDDKLSAQSSECILYSKENFVLSLNHIALNEIIKNDINLLDIYKEEFCKEIDKDFFDKRADYLNKVIIHTFVSDTTIEYFLYMRDNYSYLSFGNVEFYIYTFDEYCYSYFQDKYKTIKLDRVVPPHVDEHATGGYLHYLVIKESFKNFENCTNIIADTDTAMLMKGWDVIIKQQLEDSCCVGAPYLSNWHYKNYPAFIWIAFNGNSYGYEKYMKEPFSFGTGSLMPLTQEQCKIYNIETEEGKRDEVNYASVVRNRFDPNYYKAIIINDPGWDFPLFLNDNQLIYINFESVGRYDERSKILNRDMIQHHVEYRLEGKPIMAHMEGARGRAWRQNLNSSEFYDGIEKYLRAIL